MANITPFPGTTQLDVPVGPVCDAAKERCAALLILGVCHDGDAYFAASCSDKTQLLWWLEEFKQRLLLGEFDAD